MSNIPPPPSNNGPNWGAQPGGYQQVPMGSVNNNMVMAILTTIFCCLPLGIVSIVNAAQVNKKLATGDYNGAVQSAKQAKTWAMVAIGVGLVVIVLYFIGGVLAGLSNSSGY